MKKGLLLYAGVVVLILTTLSFQNSTDLTKCVKVKCGKKVKYVLFTGTDDTDIANQIKTNYNNCSFEFVDKRKCKNP